MAAFASELPDTPTWQQLRRLAALDGVEGIAMRRAGGASAAATAPYLADLTWPGGEIESVRLPYDDDIDELARALARELGIAL
jgi:hypothetical protein